MATIYVGSARIDENGNTSGGSAGDQLQTSTPDYSGEVSMQVMYTHSLGWYIIRPKSVSHATAIADAMTTACNNPNIGYDQNNRAKIFTNKTTSTVKTTCDCSSLSNECVREATGTTVSDYTTSTERSVLLATGLFDDIGAYVSQSATPVYNGDILVTKTKGHTVIVVSGNPRSGSSTSSGTTSSTWKATGTATCTDDDVNVRSGAGMNYSVIAKADKGNRFEIDGTETGGWTHIKISYGGSDVIGWMGSSYVKKDSASSSSGSSSGTSSSTTSKTASKSAASYSESIAGTYTTTDNLNMRDGAGTSYSILVTLPKGTSVKNYGYYTSVSGVKWLYVQVTYSGVKYTGFCSSDYLKKS